VLTVALFRISAWHYDFFTLFSPVSTNSDTLLKGIDSVSSGVPRDEGFTPPPPKFRRPAKIVPNATRL